MTSSFPDISNSTIFQKCFCPFLYAVLYGVCQATPFPLHPCPISSPSVSTLAWCRAHSTSPPYQGLRGRGDGGKPHFSIQQPSSLSQESIRARHAPYACPSGEGWEDLQSWRRRAGGRSWDAAEVLKTGWRKGRLPATSSTAISILKAGSHK